MARIVALLEWLEYDQLQRAVDLYLLNQKLIGTKDSFDFAARVRLEIIEPNLAAITLKLRVGDVSAAYLAYIIEAAIMTSLLRRERIAA